MPSNDSQSLYSVLSESLSVIEYDMGEEGFGFGDRISMHTYAKWELVWINNKFYTMFAVQLMHENVITCLFDRNNGKERR
jgi:hypothetical protein